MKHVLAILVVLVLLGGLLFAGGDQEEGPITLFIAGGGIGQEHNYLNFCLVPFLEEYPEVKLVDVPINVRDATTVTMSTRIASGLPTHFLKDYFSRVAEFVIPKSAGGNIWALDLRKYWDDIADFKPGAIDPYTSADGEVNGVAVPNMLVGMQLNKTILGKAGYALPGPDAWTLDEFMTALYAVKAVDLPEVWPTVLFAANMSGDYKYMGYFSTFGAELFRDKDYTKSTINTPAGLKTFELLKLLLDEGLVPPEAAMLQSTEFQNFLVSGRMAVGGARSALPMQFNPKYSASLLEQGVIDEPYETAFYNFPRAPGVDKVPMGTQWDTIVAFGVEDEEVNKISARFAWHYNNTRAQIFLCNYHYYFATRKSAMGIPASIADNPGWWLDARNMLVENGAMEIGGTLLNYIDVRASTFPQLQKLYTGKFTPQEALDAYEASLNAAVAGK